jgi:hypothetical protein
MLSSNGQVANDVNAQVAANNSGWLQQATGVLSALGGAASGAGTLGLGAAAQGLKICWIAAEVYYGWLDPRTVLVREWIFAELVKSRLGRIATRLYIKYGERTAGAIRKHPALRRPFKALFDCALRKAVQ